MIVASAAVSFGFGKALELLTEAQIAKASKVGSKYLAGGIEPGLTISCRPYTLLNCYTSLPMR